MLLPNWQKVDVPQVCSIEVKTKFIMQHIYAYVQVFQLISFKFMDISHFHVCFQINAGNRILDIIYTRWNVSDSLSNF